MAKILIMAGIKSVPSVATKIREFSASKDMKIVDLWAAQWDNSGHKLATSGQSTIAIYEMVGESKREILQPVNVFALMQLKNPLKIEHNPEANNKILVEGQSVASEHIAYVLRVATP